MAKKEGFSFNDLDKALSKIEGFEMGSILEKNKFSEIDHYIHSGNYIINAQLSGTLFGGFPNSKTTGISGDPATGKTFLCLNAVREAQKIGYDIIYVDTEGAIDKETCENFGIDNLRIRYQPIKTVSSFRQLANKVIEYVQDSRSKGEDPRVMIILDSIGMLTTDKEIKDAAEGKNAQDMGLKAKELRSLFRTITLDLTGNKIPFLMTNHTGAGGMYAAKKQSGGDGPIYSASSILFLSKSALKEGDTKTGIIVNSKVYKSRKAVPVDAAIHISFRKGMNPFVGLEDYISWDSCGIGKGSIKNDKEIKKESPADQKKAIEFTFGKEKMYFIEKATGTMYAVKHLGKTIWPKDLFTEEVFTMDVLKELDKKAIQPKFRFSTQSEDNGELAELLMSEENKITVENGVEESQD
jgi:RecA/RadA recombinase